MRSAAVFALALIAAAAHAAAPAGLREALERGQAGDWAAAVEAYRALQVEHPDAPAVLFGLACAQYHQAATPAAAPGAAPRLDLYREAQTLFDRVAAMPEAAERRDAAYNAAHCAAQQAIALPPQQAREKMAALRAAAAAYESVLAQYPDHEDAQADLDLVQFQLRQLMQQPQQPQQDPQPQPPPPDEKTAVVYFTQAGTDLPGASARVSEDSDTVELVRPAAPGGTP